MVRPDDPIALAALKARQAAASARYRERQKAAAATKKPRGAQPHGGGVVDAARAQSEALRRERSRILRQLPDVRGIDEATPAEKAARILPKMDTARAEGPAPKTKAAQVKRARTIRENANAKRVVNIGRARKNDLMIELTDGPISEDLQAMAPHHRQQFRELIGRITRGSAQSLGILFEHAGGQDLYSAAIGRILYPATRESGFDLLETLAEHAESAAREYSPSSINRRTGLPLGRLNI